MSNRSQFGKRRSPHLVQPEPVFDEAAFAAAAGMVPCAACGRYVHKHDKEQTPLLFNQGTGFQVICCTCYPEHYTAMSIRQRGNTRAPA